MARRGSQSKSKAADRALLDARAIVEDLARSGANEAETRRRVERIFESVLGYDPFKHLTREHAVRGPGTSDYVDFAITLDGTADGRPLILVELKRIGERLVRKHLKQVASYAINTGCEWIILTNAQHWQLYRVSFGQPPDTHRLSEWDLLKDDVEELRDRFDLIACRNVGKGCLEELWRRRSVLDPRNVLSVIVGDPSLKLLRRELRRQTDVSLSKEDVIAGLRATAQRERGRDPR